MRELWDEIFFAVDKHESFPQVEANVFMGVVRHVQLANQIAEFLDELPWIFTCIKTIKAIEKRVLF